MFLNIFLILCFLKCLSFLKIFENCSNDLDGIFRFDQIDSKCSQKHQFQCVEEVNKLNCIFFNKSFDCEANQINQLCTSPMKMIEKILDEKDKRGLLESAFRNEIVFSIFEEDRMKNGSFMISDLFLSFVEKSQTSLLSLNSLNLTNLPKFQNLNSLENLFIFGNTIESLNRRHFYNLSKLETFRFTNNNLKYLNELAFDNLVELKYLYISDNLLSSIPSKAFSNLPKLKQLFLSNNQLRTIDSNAFSNVNLEVLDLTMNNFEKVLSFHNLDNLEMLTFDSNRIKTVNCNEIKFSSKLHTLYLNYNKISAFSCDLRKLTKLYFISLRGNQLKTLEKSTFLSYLNSSKILTVTDNPLRCENLKWLVEIENQIFGDILISGQCVHGNEIHELVNLNSKLSSELLKDTDSDEFMDNSSLKCNLNLYFFVLISVLFLVNNNIF